MQFGDMSWAELQTARFQSFLSFKSILGISKAGQDTQPDLYTMYSVLNS